MPGLLAAAVAAAAGQAGPGGKPGNMAAPSPSTQEYTGLSMSLPPGIVRPVPQSLPAVQQSLLAEMASQLGRLTQLATELKSENQALRLSMDVLWREASAATAAAAAVAAGQHGLGSGSGNQGTLPAAPRGQSTPTSGGNAQGRRDGGLSEGNSQASGSHDGMGVPVMMQQTGSAPDNTGGSGGSAEQPGASGASLGGPQPGMPQAGSLLPASLAMNQAGSLVRSDEKLSVQPLEVLLAEHQEKFLALKLRNDEVELQVREDSRHHVACMKLACAQHMACLQPAACGARFTDGGSTPGEHAASRTYKRARGSACSTAGEH